jgi:hypothetical protein
MLESDHQTRFDELESKSGLSADQSEVHLSSFGIAFPKSFAAFSGIVKRSATSVTIKFETEPRLSPYATALADEA